MTNFEFIVRGFPECMRTRAEEGGHPDEDAYPAFSMDSICEVNIDSFTGTTVARDNARVIFHIVNSKDLEDSFSSFIKTRFFQTLKEIKGFQ